MSNLQAAKDAIAQLLADAKTGNIIPIRLPAQIEAIQALVEEAEEAHDEEIRALKNRPGGDAGDIVEDMVEFVRVAVHDLKNPLASIKGYGDLLNNPAMGGELTDMQKQLLKVIRSNTHRMESLLSDVSTINKIRAGVLNIQPKIDMFKNIAGLAEKSAQPLVKELGRELAFDIPQGLPIMEIDGAWLAEALVKLIENGLRYSPEDTGKVTISAHADGNNVVIQVSDNGIGMSEATLNRLGEMFFRADDEAVRAYKGSGLGIPIAYGLIEGLDGQISVESELGAGTTFTIVFSGMT
ncbi:MAG: sensor histidine kinase [Anaerolineaceae bacterium]|nr:MAG: sensor histidine kinase [Anaerolineaceae bacterium]